MGAQVSVRLYPRDGSLRITQAGMFNCYLKCFLHPIRLYCGLLIYAMERLLMIKKNFLNFSWLLFCVIIRLIGNPGSWLFWGSKLGARALGCWIFNFTMVWLLTPGFGQVTFAFLVATSPFLKRDPILETSWFTEQGRFPPLSFFKGTEFESHLLDAIEDEFQKTKRNPYQVSAPVSSSRVMSWHWSLMSLFSSLFYWPGLWISFSVEPVSIYWMEDAHMKGEVFIAPHLELMEREQWRHLASHAVSELVLELKLLACHLWLCQPKYLSYRNPKHSTHESHQPKWKGLETSWYLDMFKKREKWK